MNMFVNGTNNQTWSFYVSQAGSSGNLGTSNQAFFAKDFNLVAADNPLRTDANNTYIFQIQNYANSSTYKKIDAVSTYAKSGGTRVISANFGMFVTNTAVSSITINENSSGTFSTGTVLLYGVK
jgi:hypothetical protein